MKQREFPKASPIDDLNSNKFLTAQRNKELKGVNNQDEPKYEDTKRIMLQMEEQNMTNSYAFQIRFADKDKTIFFPKREVDALSADIGIDIERDKTNHLWFLQQALMSELPYGWEKEQDLQGSTIYHNYLINVNSNSHPNIHKFRISFNDILKSEKVKNAISDEILVTLTKAEKMYLQTQIQTLSRIEKENLAKKIRNILGKDEEDKAIEIKKQIIKCKFL